MLNNAKKTVFLGLVFNFFFVYTVFAQIANPLKAGSIPELLKLIIDAGIMILMPLVVLAIIYSGFMFLMAQGNEDKLKTAKTNFIWVIVGVAVLLGAKVISAVLQATAEHIVH